MIAEQKACQKIVRPLQDSGGTVQDRAAMNITAGELARITASGEHLGSRKHRQRRQEAPA